MSDKVPKMVPRCFENRALHYQWTQAKQWHVWCKKVRVFVFVCSVWSGCISYSCCRVEMYQISYSGWLNIRPFFTSRFSLKCYMEPDIATRYLSYLTNITLYYTMFIVKLAYLIVRFQCTEATVALSDSFQIAKFTIWYIYTAQFCLCAFLPYLLYYNTSYYYCLLLEQSGEW